MPEIYQEPTNDELAAFHEHQSTAARPSVAEEARTIMQFAK